MKEEGRRYGIIEVNGGGEGTIQAGSVTEMKVGALTRMNMVYLFRARMCAGTMGGISIKVRLKSVICHTCS